MARKAITPDLYNYHRQAGLSNEQIADLYKIQPSTLEFYLLKWKQKRDSALERQYFLIAMREAAGLTQYELAFRMGIKPSQIIFFENLPFGIEMSDDAWSKFELNVRLVVNEEIVYRRQKKLLKIAR